MAKRLSLGKKREVPAGVFKRIVAFLIDLIVLNFVVALPFRGVVGRLVPIDSGLKLLMEADPRVMSQLNLVYIVMGMLAFFYFTISEYVLKQSLGKMVMGLYIKSKTNTLHLIQVFVRNLFILPVFPFVLLWIADPITLIFLKQRLSDMASSTRVIAYETKLWLQ